MESGAQWTGSAAKREKRRFAVRAGGSRLSDEPMVSARVLPVRNSTTVCRMVM